MENQIKGEIQNIKSNRKSLCIEGNWFNSFTLLPEDLNKGDLVEITYTIKQVNDKSFNNIKSIKILDSPIQSVKPIESNEVTAIKRFTTDTSVNCILMQSVQYAKDKGFSLDKSTDEVIASYKKIINSI